MISPVSIFNDLNGSLGDAVHGHAGEGQDAVIFCKVSALRGVLSQLKNKYGFNVLVDLTAVDYSSFKKKKEHPNPEEFILRVEQDYHPQDRRFRLTYRLMSLDAEKGLVNGRIAVQCWAGENGPKTMRDLWPNADWLEREIWDMFGIKFADRPGIERILMYEEFVGHPLRKEYPINKRQPLLTPVNPPERGRMLESDLRPKVT